MYKNWQPLWDSVLVVKSLPDNRRCKRHGFNPWVEKIPWSRKFQDSRKFQWEFLGFLPGKFHGQGSLTGYSSWGCKQSDLTEWLTLLLFHCIAQVTLLNMPSNLIGKILWRRIDTCISPSVQSLSHVWLCDTCICITESLCTPETTTLLINYIKI